MKNQAFATLVVAYISVTTPPPTPIKASIEVMKTFLYH